MAQAKNIVKEFQYSRHDIDASIKVIYSYELAMTINNSPRGLVLPSDDEKLKYTTILISLDRIRAIKSLTQNNF